MFRIRPGLFFSCSVLLALLSGCLPFRTRSAGIDFSGCPAIENPIKGIKKSEPFSLQMKTVLKFKNESFSMIMVLSADPKKGLYHCQMLTPFGVKCLEFKKEEGILKDIFVFPAMNKMNRKNRLITLISEALEKSFTPSEIEEAVFRVTPVGLIGSLTRGRNEIYAETDRVSGLIKEKKYFIRGRNVVNISYLNNKPSDSGPFSGEIRYHHLKSGLEIILKRISLNR